MRLANYENGNNTEIAPEFHLEFSGTPEYRAYLTREWKAIQERNGNTHKGGFCVYPDNAPNRVYL